MHVVKFGRPAIPLCSNRIVALLLISPVFGYDLIENNLAAVTLLRLGQLDSLERSIFLRSSNKLIFFCV